MRAAICHLSQCRGAQQQCTHLLRGLVVDAAGMDAVANPTPAGAPWLDQVRVAWPGLQDTASWLATLDVAALRASFHEDGYVVVHDLVPPEHLVIYRDLHDRMHSGSIDASNTRHEAA